MRVRVRTWGAATPVLCVAFTLAGLRLALAPGMPEGTAQAETAKAIDAARIYVHPRDFDVQTLLGDPPAAGSAVERAEVATLLALQNRRTAEQVNRCRREATHAGVWLFSDVLGDGFNQQTHPLTASLFDEVQENSEPVIQASKRLWQRARPAVVHPEIMPCVGPEISTSYPSGHAANSLLEAIILAEIFPEQRDALLKRGRLVGTDRVIAGIHYPSDVAAGQKLGEAIARRLLDDRDFRIELQRAAEECRAGSAAAGDQPATAPAAPTTRPDAPTTMPTGMQAQATLP